MSRADAGGATATPRDSGSQGVSTPGGVPGSGRTPPGVAPGELGEAQPEPDDESVRVLLLSEAGPRKTPAHSLFR